MKQFITPAFVSKPSYGGFDCNNWAVRDIAMHTLKAFEYRNASTSAEQKKFMHDTGIKYSEMVLIPNFNVIRGHVIDPMHCLFSGISKTCSASMEGEGHSPVASLQYSTRKGRCYHSSFKGRTHTSKD